MNTLTTTETLERISASGEFKATAPVWKLFLLGILAGCYIAFGAYASTMASFNLVADPDSFGLGKLVAGAVFPVGLMLVVLCGAELFTGNCLMVTGLFDRRFGVGALLRNWGVVYLGNLAGSLLMAAMINYSGLLASGEGLLGAITIKAAIGKCSLPFGKAFILGILCNWMVCLAVWMATAAQAAAGKILAIWFCIGLFIISGFEHSVANMYFIPAGIIASGHADWVGLLGLDPSCLTLRNFFLKNLLPVTLGNIVGGGGFVGAMYWIVNRR